jgi:hypothetical protein
MLTNNQWRLIDDDGCDGNECDCFVAGVLPALTMIVPKTTILSSKQPRYRLQNHQQPGRISHNQK